MHRLARPICIYCYLPNDRFRIEVTAMHTAVTVYLPPYGSFLGKGCQVKFIYFGARNFA
ncbi:hypothetical protein BABINDRAFT_91186 [Babjeviella inositovora NRRL Y-12698]|uniref:Uncharacterized protein n=1 Tax=Babjeviella inositovora NRRL Y-12698 TaxID=984486 RepID=A0A1E3QK54_9ASCO|nr:uncharacterized protein BABINDRAFT_91186 [Babjeviella inositovora NRRL Y-12698]ODQ77998.1 hypothetical protein BABINDRAFT_91186 [Babjeviella inositovora NRRL Y-12698]